MSAPLYDFTRLMANIFFQKLTPELRALVMQLMVLADPHGGRLTIGAELPRLCGIEGNVFADMAGRLCAAGLMMMEGNDILFPDMTARHDLRQKRKAAGSRGGKATMGVVSASSDDLLKQNDAQVISFEKSKASARARVEAAKKEKRTKKEKNIKYIYIYQTKVDVSDRGTAQNPKWLDGRAFTLFRREFDAIAAAFPDTHPDDLFAMLSRQDDWLADQADSAQRHNWLGVTLGWLKQQLGEPVSAAA